MGFDRSLLADKLRRYRAQFEVSLPELSQATGIPIESLDSFEKERQLPTGDEILILSEFYKCDYKFFISNEKLAPFEQTETMFRRYGDAFSKNDRWVVQEMLFLAECEYFLMNSLGLYHGKTFTFGKTGNNFKQQGIDAASALRTYLAYPDHGVPMDVYDDFRSIGLHVFRRKLEGSNISGLFIKHPWCGKCVLINYNEDIYRQRFTAAHETGHSILDDEEDFVVSFTKWAPGDRREIRANTFASRYLMPHSFLIRIPDPTKWDNEKTLQWANKLKVSTEALAYSLRSAGLITEDMVINMKSIHVPRSDKEDPELPTSLSNRERIRKKELLERGLSSFYVSKCFEAYRRSIISAARMAEMMLISQDELASIALIYGEILDHDN
ncbi:MAG: XRE family transcriptional regulator [Syntrophobacteraceae bacterium]